MYIGGLLCECGSYLAVVLERLVASAYVSLSADYPCVVVSEDTCILLVAAGICGNLAVLDVVLCECGVVENETELAVEVLVDGVEGLDVCSDILAYLGHYSEALRLDEYLALLALVRAHLLAVCVVSSEEPLAVKCRLHNVLLHLVYLSLSLCSLIVLAEVLEDTHISGTCVCEESSNECGLSYLGVAALCLELGVSIGLEALAGCVREA